MTKIDLTPIEEAARAMREAQAEIVRLRDELANVREVNAAQAQRIEALQEQLRQAQQRRTFARSGE